MPSTQRHTVKTKLEAIEMLKTMSSFEVAKKFDVDPSTIRKWASKHAKYSDVANKKSKNKPTAGRPEALPDPQALVDYITERRSRERAVTSRHVINFMSVPNARGSTHTWRLMTLTRRTTISCG